jgi:prepilin-type processing-associated H-X9-DG protein
MFAETLLGPGGSFSGSTPPGPQSRWMVQYGTPWKPASPQQGVTNGTGGPVVVNPDLASLVGAVNSWSGTRGSAWIRGLETTSTITGYLTPNSPVPDFTAHGRTFSGPRSNHSGGANVAMGDGSVRFVRDSIPIVTWRALATRAGGEVVSGTDF